MPSPSAPQETEAPEGAAAETRLRSMNVEIWPEYDDPRVLVIYSGMLEPEVETPRDFAIVVPAGADVHMAGAVDEQGNHIHASFRTEDAGEGLTRISYELTSPNFYMEFYYDPFGADEERRFEYPLVSLYDVAHLRVSVQEPLRASEFSVSPAAPDVVRDGKGFTYHVLELDGIPAGDARSVTVSYRKPDREPSVGPQPSVPGPPSTLRRPPDRRWRIIMGIGVATGIALLLALGYRLYRYWSGDDEDEVYVWDEPDVDSPLRGAARFCSQCGRRAAPGDRFCGTCGHPLRRSVGDGAAEPEGP